VVRLSHLRLGLITVDSDIVAFSSGPVTILFFVLYGVLDRLADSPKAGALEEGWRQTGLDSQGRPAFSDPINARSRARANMTRTHASAKSAFPRVRSNRIILSAAGDR